MICVGIGGITFGILSRNRKGETVVQTRSITHLQFAAHLLFVAVLLTVMLWSLFHSRPPGRGVNMMGLAVGLLSGIAIALINDSIPPNMAESVFWMR